MMTKRSLDLDIPRSWKNAAGKILSKCWRKILVIGGIDRGKSTFCRYLSETILASSQEVSLVDADVGQKDVGPPSTITLGYPSLLNEFEDIEPAAYYFVGSVTPEGHLLPMVVGTKKMVEISRTPFVIINTTGLIHQTGRILKGYKIELVRPDVIVAIERSNELKSIINQYRNHRIIRIEPSVKAVRKDIEERRKRREAAFASYFKNYKEVELDLGKLMFQRSLLFSGKRIKSEGSIYSEITSEGVISVKDESAKLSGYEKKLVVGFEKNLLCGLGNWRNHCIGLGIIKEIDFVRENIHLLTPVEEERIRIIQPGDIYIEPDGREIGRKRPGGL